MKHPDKGVLVAQREQVKKRSAPADTVEVEDDEPVTDRGAKLKEEMDELLDEIDGVLESNAAEFVAQYIQKGGE